MRLENYYIQMYSIVGICAHVYRLFTPVDSTSTNETTTRRMRKPNRTWDADDELRVTDKCRVAVQGAADHKRKRYEDLSQCQTLGDAMQLTIQPTRRGALRKYSTADLSYDIKIGYVQL
jgi:hypothetical protein